MRALHPPRITVVIASDRHSYDMVPTPGGLPIPAAATTLEPLPTFAPFKRRPITSHAGSTMGVLRDRVGLTFVPFNNNHRARWQAVVDARLNPASSHHTFR
jgi:hypothetical protein